MKLVHGGDWAGYRAEFGRDALDFSANVSPLGLPHGVAAAISAALPMADRYPDPLCRALRTKLAAAEGVDAAQILCGNGAADLIYRLALALRPRRALLPAPTFAEYAAALETVDCDVQRFLLREESDFAVTDGFVDAIDDSTDAVFLCQPNNPTGQVTPLVMVQKLLRRCADCGAVLVVDECFLDFLAAREALTAKTVLRDAPNLIILKAFTKLYAMAGVRLGYALCSDAALLDKISPRAVENRLDINGPVRLGRATRLWQTFTRMQKDVDVTPDKLKAPRKRQHFYKAAQERKRRIAKEAEAAARKSRATRLMGAEKEPKNAPRTDER